MSLGGVMHAELNVSFGSDLSARIKPDREFVRSLGKCLGQLHLQSFLSRSRRNSLDKESLSLRPFIDDV